jgi:hypothetical protein
VQSQKAIVVAESPDYLSQFLWDHQKIDENRAFLSIHAPKVTWYVPKLVLQISGGDGKIAMLTTMNTLSKGFVSPGAANSQCWGKSLIHRHFSPDNNS